MRSMGDLATNQGQCQGGMTKKCLGEKNSWGGQKARSVGSWTICNWIHSKPGKRGPFSMFFYIIEEE